MTRRLQTLALLGIVCLLALGTPGDTQVPEDALPPWTLSTQEDFGVARAFLEATRATWVESIASGGTVSSLGLRSVVQYSGDAVYLGSAHVQYGSAIPTLSTAAPPLAGRYRFVYVHTVGGPCDTPPDVLFSGNRESASCLREYNGLSTTMGLDLLIHVLGQLEDPDLGSDFEALSAWCAGDPNVAFENFRLQSSSEVVELFLMFRESGTNVDEIHTVHIVAQLTPSGLQQIEVQ